MGLPAQQQAHSRGRCADAPDPLRPWAERQQGGLCRGRVSGAEPPGHEGLREGEEGGRVGAAGHRDLRGHDVGRRRVQGARVRARDADRGERAACGGARAAAAEAQHGGLRRDPPAQARGGGQRHQRAEDPGRVLRSPWCPAVSNHELNKNLRGNEEIKKGWMKQTK